MTVGLIPAQANAILNSLCRAAAYSAPAAVYIKLHIGDPGAAGTSNPATNTTRVQATFGSVASGGTISNTATVDWTSVPAAEDYTHFSAWDASSAGNALFTGTITANSVAIGDNFSIPVGDCDVSLNVAA